METKGLFKNFYVWLIIAFMGGFVVSSALAKVNLNPMQGKAFLSIQRNMCTSFEGDTATMACSRYSQPYLIGDFETFGGGFGGGYYSTDPLPNSFGNNGWSNTGTMCSDGIPRTGINEGLTCADTPRTEEDLCDMGFSEDVYGNPCPKSYWW